MERGLRLSLSARLASIATVSSYFQVRQHVRVADIYREFGSLVMWRALTVLNNESDAEEILHEVFCVLLETGPVFENKRALVGWLYRVTLTRSLNMIRNRQRRGKLEKSQQMFLEDGCTTLPIDEKLFAHHVLSDVPTSLAAAGILYYINGMTQAEIGEVLNVSRRTASNMVSRFIREAKKVIKGDV